MHADFDKKCLLDLSNIILLPKMQVHYFQGIVDCTFYGCCVNMNNLFNFCEKLRIRAKAGSLLRL